MEVDPRLQTEYIDAAQQPAFCSPEAQAAVLAALGPERSAPDAVVVAWDGRLPDGVIGEVLDEDGHRLPHGAPLPLGYHHLVRAGRRVGTVISAPDRAPAIRPGRWGVLLPLYSLRTARTARTQGLATYGDLSELFDWLHGHGGDTVLTLPLLPTFLDPPADWSPYSPVTRRMWNENYVDFDALGAPTPGPPPDLDRDGLLDHVALGAHRAWRLDAVAERLLDDPEFAAWRSTTALADTYARFRGAQAVFGRNPRTWPVGHAQALAAADPVVTRRHLVGTWLADRQLGEVAGHAARQGQVLALDVALGTHADGFDVWHEGDLFVDGVSVGAPPDPLFMGGQDWGFPPVHPERSRATGHRYIRETLRHHLRHAKLLRLDHVMGLMRQWWVPRGMPASDGCYVRYPLEELMAVAVLEAHLAGAVVVGENLGTVPPEVDEQMQRHGMLGISVALDCLPTWGTDSVLIAGSGTMSMVSTHDSYPFAGWWQGGDVHMMRRLQLITDDEVPVLLARRATVRERVVGHLVWTGRLAHHQAPLDEVMAGVADEVASQPADITLFNLEDFWLEDRPQNVPGTFQEEPNWRRTATRTVEELTDDPQVAALAQRIAARRRESAARSAAG